MHFESTTRLALPQTPLSQETLLGKNGSENNTTKDSDEVSIDNGSNNGDVTITTSNPRNIQSGSHLQSPPNLGNHQTNLHIPQPNNAASSTTSNIDTSSVLAARE